MKMVHIVLLYVKFLMFICSLQEKINLPI